MARTRYFSGSFDTDRYIQYDDEDKFHLHCCLKGSLVGSLKYTDLMLFNTTSETIIKLGVILSQTVSLRLFYMKLRSINIYASSARVFSGFPRG